VNPGQEARLLATLDHERSWREMLQAKLAAVEISAREAHEQLALARAEGHRHHQASSRTAKVCTSLQERLLELEAALRQAEHQRVSDATSAVDRLTQRHAEFTASLAQVARSRDALAQQLNAAMAALDDVRRDREADRSAAADQLRQREAEFETTLAASTAARVEVEQQVHDLRAALDRFTRREADLLEQLAHESDARAGLEQNLDVSERTGREAEERHQVELASAAARFGDLQTAFDDARRQAAEMREGLERQLSEGAAALDRAHEDRAADAVAASDRLAAREADLLGQLARESNTRATLEQNLEHSERAGREAEERHQLELAAASSRLVDQQNAFEEARQHAARIREGLERQVSEAGAALDRAMEDRAADAAAAADRLATREADLLEQLARESETRATLEQSLEHSERRGREAEEHYQVELAAAASRFGDLQSAFEEARQQAAEIRETLERQLSETGAALAAMSAAQRAVEQQAEDLRITVGQLTEREANLLEQLARESEARAALEQNLDHSERTRRESEERHRLELDIAAADLAREVEARTNVERELGGLRNESARARSRILAAASALRRRTSDRRTQLETQLACAREDYEQRLAARAEVIQQVELERDTLQQSLDATAVQLQELSDTYTHERQEFERAQSYAESELQRLAAEHDEALKSLDHLRTAFNTLESVSSEHALERARLESVVADRDARISVQESAHLAAEQAGREALRQAEEALRQAVSARNSDVARLQRDLDAGHQEVRRTLENLRQARHMEAVGRLAQEVAATCATLLRNVSRSGEQWLAAVSSDPVLRDQGEQILGDVGQVSSLLQRLNAYGREQLDAREPAKLSNVLRNLEPVLRRIAGDDIDLLLPKTIPSYSVDIDRPRLERVLVNVTSHARDRMPNGGRLKIDLASAMVDKAFLDRFPNVRPGRHVIATVTEERSTAPRSAAHATAPPSDNKAGMDLSVLVRLLGDCGGHLWVTAEPTGNMTLKIHLPLRSSDEAMPPQPTLTRSTRGSSLARWFRH
jgi:chromosome segregation ATPase